MDLLRRREPASPAPSAVCGDAPRVRRRNLCRCASSSGICIALLMLAAGPALGATYHARDGASLEAAIAAASAGSGPSTIELSGGTFMPSSTLAVSGDVTILGPSAGRAARLDGGAVSPYPSDLLLVERGARLAVWNVELTSGGGAGSGAGIDDLGALDLESSTLVGNGGPGLLVQPGGTATVRNSTLSDGLDFGVVDLGTASLLNATIASNTHGGVADEGGVLRLTNTIVADNGSSDCTRPATVSDRSLDGDGSCRVGALARTDPRLGALAANGGPTMTQALGQGSPAIDAGDNSNCPRQDQRHFARSDGHCDIGAYEAGAVPVPGGAGVEGAGPAGSRGAGGRGGGLVGVSARGTLLGARRSRIAFSVRAV